MVYHDEATIGVIYSFKLKIDKCNEMDISLISHINRL